MTEGYGMEEKRLLENRPRSVITSTDLTEELLRLSKALDEHHNDLLDKSSEWATKEDLYRLAKASAYLAATGTVQERQSHVDKATSAERRAAHLSESLRVAALERVRSTRAQMSALQSVANAVKSEIEMAGRHG